MLTFRDQGGRTRCIVARVLWLLSMLIVWDVRTFCLVAILISMLTFRDQGERTCCIVAILMSMLTFRDQGGRTRCIVARVLSMQTFWDKVHTMSFCNFDVNVDFPGPGWTHTCIVAILISMLTFRKQGGPTRCIVASMLSMLLSGPGWTHTLYYIKGAINVDFLGSGCTHCLFAILISMLTFQDQGGPTRCIVPSMLSILTFCTRVDAQPGWTYTWCCCKFVINVDFPEPCARVVDAYCIVASLLPMLTFPNRGVPTHFYRCKFVMLIFRSTRIHCIFAILISTLTFRNQCVYPHIVLLQLCYQSWFSFLCEMLIKMTISHGTKLLWKPQYLNAWLLTAWKFSSHLFLSFNLPSCLFLPHFSLSDSVYLSFISNRSRLYFSSLHITQINISSSPLSLLSLPPRLSLHISPLSRHWRKGETHIDTLFPSHSIKLTRLPPAPNTSID